MGEGDVTLLGLLCVGLYQQVPSLSPVQTLSSSSSLCWDSEKVSRGGNGDAEGEAAPAPLL